MPFMQKVRERLAKLNTAQLNALADSSKVTLSTIDRIKTGRTPNPGIETVRSLLKHLPEARKVKGVTRKRKARLQTGADAEAVQ